MKTVRCKKKRSVWSCGMIVVKVGCVVRSLCGEGYNWVMLVRIVT